MIHFPGERKKMKEIKYKQKINNIADQLHFNELIKEPKLIISSETPNDNEASQHILLT